MLRDAWIVTSWPVDQLLNFNKLISLAIQLLNFNKLISLAIQLLNSNKLMSLAIQLLNFNKLIFSNSIIEFQQAHLFSWHSIV